MLLAQCTSFFVYLIPSRVFTPILLWSMLLVCVLGIASLRQRSQSENKQRVTIIQNDKSMQDKSRSIPRALRLSLVFFENLHCQMSDFLLCFPYLQSWALSRRFARLAKQMLMIHIHWVFLVAGPPWSFFVFAAVPVFMNSLGVHLQKLCDVMAIDTRCYSYFNLAKGLARSLGLTQAALSKEKGPMDESAI